MLLILIGKRLMKNPPELTLDNNCVISLLDYESPTATFVEELSEIVSIGLSGSVRIAVTTRVEADLGNDKDESRKREMLRKVRLFPVIGSLFRVDLSILDGKDVVAGDDTVRLAEEIQSILYPSGLDSGTARFWNKANDVDHLVGHRINGRDIFVTADRGILKKVERLKASLGIVVMSPSECLRHLRRG